MSIIRVKSTFFRKPTRRSAASTAVRKRRERVDFAALSLIVREKPVVRRREGHEVMPNKYLLAAVVAAAALAMYASVFVKFASP